MRVFVSHAWEDKPLALELAKLPPFIHPWVDVRELLGGQQLDPTIIEAIEDSHVFLALVSEVSIGKRYVAKEVAWALEREAKELRKANEILKLASAFFAQAELDRRLKS